MTNALSVSQFAGVLELMKRTFLLILIGGAVSGCAAKLDLQPTDFLASRQPIDAQTEVRNDRYSSVTAGYEPRRAIDPEPWDASSGVPPRTGGEN